MTEDIAFVRRMGPEVAEIENNDGQSSLRGFMSSNNDQSRRRREHHKYVTDRRSTSAVQCEIVDSLVEFVTQRFAADE